MFYNCCLHGTTWQYLFQWFLIVMTYMFEVQSGGEGSSGRSLVESPVFAGVGFFFFSAARSVGDVATP